MPQRPGEHSFYEIAKEHKRKSRVLFIVLLAFNTAAVIIFFLAISAIAGLFFARPQVFSVSTLAGLAPLAVFFSLALAAFEFGDARRNGPPFILKRLSAQTPDLADRYHQRLADVVEEMRIASGLEEVKAYVIPDHTVNCLALVEPDATPCIVMTEGMLADFTRDELQAAAAHEAAHILRGDAVFMTLVYALGDFFERLRDLRQSSDSLGPDHPLPLTTLLVRFLVRTISREREVLADAVAVELSRSPIALARAIYKAHLGNSFVGAFDPAYASLFIVSPGSGGNGEDGKTDWWDTHPPLMKRIRVLAEMAHLKAEDVIRQVWDGRAGRETAQSIQNIREKTSEESPAAPDPTPLPAGGCPRCGIPLGATFYEGVPIGICHRCGGKLVEEKAVDRILARTEIGFAPELRRKAEAFRARFLRNPIAALKMNDRVSPHPPCPNCGYPMRTRPFNYAYFVPVDKCLSCFRLWFDADELEILQILVEEAKNPLV